jgi:hypothetical protein
MKNRIFFLLVPVFAFCAGIVLCFLILTREKPQAIFALKGQHILACRNAAGNRTQKHNALKGQKNK